MGQSGWRAVRGKHDVRLVQSGPAEPKSPRKQLGFLLSAAGSRQRVEGVVAERFSHLRLRPSLSVVSTLGEV